MPEHGLEDVFFPLQRVNNALIEFTSEQINVDTGIPLLTNSVYTIFELRACVERPGVFREYHSTTSVLWLDSTDQGVSILPSDGLDKYTATLWVFVEDIPLVGYFGAVHAASNNCRLILKESLKQNFSGISVVIHDYDFSGDFSTDDFLECDNSRVGGFLH
jgi:hypothetical protein